MIRVRIQVRAVERTRHDGGVLARRWADAVVTMPAVPRVGDTISVPEAGYLDVTQVVWDLEQGPLIRTRELYAGSIAVDGEHDVESIAQRFVAALEKAAAGYRS